MDATVNYLPTQNPWTGFTFADQFAAQWRGYLLLDSTGGHTFQLDSDDGSRMYLEGVQVINHAIRPGISIWLRQGWLSSHEPSGPCDSAQAVQQADDTGLLRD